MEPPAKRGLDQQAVYALIARFAGQANVLTIPRLFIAWAGDHVSALLLSQIIYWSSRTTDPEGWFYKSAKEWEEELGISDYQLARATKKLADAGVVTKLRKVHGAPTLHYRLDQERFLAWISEKLGNGFLAPADVGSRETRKSISDALANALPRSSAMDSLVTRQSLTEITAETMAEREGFEDSNGLDVKNELARTTIAAYLADFARELHDQAPLPSSIGRAVNLYRESGRPLERFLEALYTARATTQQYSGLIKAEPVGEGPWPVKPKMAYFFAVLEDVLAHEERSAD